MSSVVFFLLFRKLDKGLQSVVQPHRSSHAATRERTTLTEAFSRYFIRQKRKGLLGSLHQVDKGAALR